MKRALDNSLGKVHTPLSYFQTIAATPDMITLYIRESELGDYFEQALYLKDELFLFPGDPLIYGENDIIANEFFAEELKTAILLNKWIDEIPEDTLTTTFNIGPGDLRNKVETARWLLHAMERIAALYHFDHRILKNVIRRITYGVKEELLPLVVFKGIGRVRARLLHKHGYRDAGNLKKADIHDLLEIDGIGKSTVLRIMEELGRDVSEIMEADEEIQRLQKTLFEFGITRK